MRNLIPNTITVSEQFKKMRQFNQAAETIRNNGSWQQAQDDLENIYGITIQLKVQNGYYRCLHPRIIDEKKYLFYLLKWT